MWFAHSAGWLGFLLFAPMFGALLLQQPNAPLAGTPEYAVLGLGAIGQFLMCWLVVHAVRAAFRKVPRGDGYPVLMADAESATENNHEHPDHPS